MLSTAARSTVSRVASRVAVPTSGSVRRFGDAAATTHDHHDDHHGPAAGDDPYSRTFFGKLGLLSAASIVITTAVYNLRRNDNPSIYAKEFVLNQTDFKVPERAAYP